MNNRAIEDLSVQILNEIWEHRSRFLPDHDPNMLEVLEPEFAASILGIGFEYREDLGRFGYRGTHFEVAGQINRGIGKISVSRKFPPEVMRFTGAHEIGHWLLHPGEGMHRDRPIKGLDHQSASRPQIEKEADYFAACFLMPAILVKRAFKLSFGTNKFEFSEELAFHFCRSDPDSLLRPHTGSLDRELALSTAESFAGIRFASLAKRFWVSPTTMAIRLRELNLIHPPV